VARSWRKTNVTVRYDEEKERRIFQAQNLVDMTNVEVMRAIGVGERVLPLVVSLHAGVGVGSEPVVA
jgi:hypothetical protein